MEVRVFPLILLFNQRLACGVDGFPKRIPERGGEGKYSVQLEPHNSIGCLQTQSTLFLADSKGPKKSTRFDCSHSAPTLHQLGLVAFVPSSLGLRLSKCDAKPLVSYGIAAKEQATPRQV